MTEAKKFDHGKPRMSLLERLFLEGVARVLTFGAKKYADRNYRKGIAMSRYLDAAMRHLVAFIDGEDADAESGESHLYHAACCLMMADWTHINKPEFDDRDKAMRVVVGVDLAAGKDTTVVTTWPMGNAATEWARKEQERENQHLRDLLENDARSITGIKRYRAEMQDISVQSAKALERNGSLTPEGEKVLDSMMKPHRAYGPCAVPGVGY